MQTWNTQVGKHILLEKKKKRQLGFNKDIAMQPLRHEKRNEA